MQRSVSLLARQRLYTAVGRLAGLRRLENSQFHDRLQLAAEAGRLAG
jgi:ATP-binding cassette, subfamily B, bacterial